MNLTKIVILIFLSLRSFIAESQYLNGVPIQETELSDWIAEEKSDYFGFYLFGDDIRSKVVFRVLHNEDSLVVQLETKYKYEGKTDWDRDFFNLTNPVIDLSGNFSSDQFKGKFLVFEKAGKRLKLLKINEAFTFFDSEAYELGSKVENVHAVLDGKFIEASAKVLKPMDITDLSQSDLKIMRNEIFARYGYKFKDGGEMDIYFRSQHWFQPQFSDVTNLLTGIEKRNIKLILKEESK